MYSYKQKCTLSPSSRTKTTLQHLPKKNHKLKTTCHQLVRKNLHQSNKQLKTKKYKAAPSKKQHKSIKSTNQK